jgi:cytochrome c oxidase subunit 3
MAESDSTVGEPVRRGEGAEGFPHGSKYPLFVGLGFLLLGWGLMWAPVLVAGVPVMLYGVWGWTREYAIDEYEAGVVPEQKRQLLGIESGLLGMYVLIVSEILIFMGFFVAWFYLDATRGPFPPDGFPGLSLTTGAAMTAVMLVGSGAVRYGRHRIADGDRSGLVRGYAVAFVTGVAFLALLGVEYSRPRGSAGAPGRTARPTTRSPACTRPTCSPAWRWSASSSTGRGPAATSARTAT